MTKVDNFKHMGYKGIGAETIKLSEYNVIPTVQKKPGRNYHAYCMSGYDSTYLYMSCMFLISPFKRNF